MILQETRKEIGNTSKYSYLNRVRLNSQGGGISIKVNLFSESSVIDYQAFSKRKRFCFIQYIFYDIKIYIFNVYMRNFRQKKYLVTLIRDCLINTQNSKPKSLVILAGDFNTNKSPFPELNQLCNNHFTFKRVIEGRVI